MTTRIKNSTNDTETIDIKLKFKLISKNDKLVIIEAIKNDNEKDTKKYTKIDIKGKFINIDKVIDEKGLYNIDCYTNGKILFRIRRKVIPNEMQLLLKETFLKHANTINTQRAVASGGKRAFKGKVSYSTVECRSAIAGYYDKPEMYIKHLFPSSHVCRKTSFNVHNEEAFNKCIPFFKLVSKYYKELAPEYYKKQIEAIKRVPNDFRISNTPFTTVTINYNWRTACHKDVGDYTDGFGNLAVIGNNFKGGDLIFPEFNVAVGVRPGDIVIFDVHEYHCNTKLTADKDNYRLSFVNYLREGMLDCNIKKEVNGNVYYHR